MKGKKCTMDTDSTCGDRNQKVFQRVIDEVFNQERYEFLAELFTPKIIEHQFGMQDTPASLQSKVGFLHHSFPDFRLTIEEMVSDGETARARMAARGTNSVGFMGPPNGKRFGISVFDEVRIEDGKIVGH